MPAPTILDAVAADPDFDILEGLIATMDAVAGTDYAGLLDDPEASVTLLAPTDEAFLALAATFGFEGTDEEAALTYLLDAFTLLGFGSPLGLIRDVLDYHILPTALTEDAIAAETALGTLIPVGIGVNAAGGDVVLVDGDGGAADPTIVEPDILASNGVVQGIDGVLRPFRISSSLEGGEFVIGTDRADRLATGDGDDRISGKAGGDRLDAGAGNDVLLGQGGADRLHGEDGRDVLLGDVGQDRLWGGDGEDLLNGGDGMDRLWGGAGADTFQVNVGDSQERVMDFDPDLDRIVLNDVAPRSFEALDIRDTSYGCRIELGGNDEVQVMGISASELTAENVLVS